MRHEPISARRVVITGLGLVTPLGNSVETTWAGLMAGKSGAGPITKFDADEFPVRFACEVKNFDPLRYIDTNESADVAAFTQFAIAASDEALANSDFKITRDTADRIGVFISSGIGDLHRIEREHGKFAKSGPNSILRSFLTSVLAESAPPKQSATSMHMAPRRRSAILAKRSP
jgi:3-oxoacyl-[acyl-carrier-protein] synthase II